MNRLAQEKGDSMTNFIIGIVVGAAVMAITLWGIAAMDDRYKTARLRDFWKGDE
jgi:hypothetical protein